MIFIFNFGILSGCKRLPPPPDEEIPKVENLSLGEYVDKLSADEFTTSGLKGNYGLTDAENVGVNKSDFEKEIYPSLKDTEITALGGTILEWETFAEGSQSNYHQMLAMFNRAKELMSEKVDKPVKIKLPEGPIEIESEYSSSDSFTYMLNGFKKLYIEGDNTKILIKIKGIEFRGFLHFENCVDIRINNIILDYVIPSIFTGQIKSYDETEKTVTVQIFPEFNELISRIATFNQTNVDRMLFSYIEFDSITNAVKEGGNYGTGAGKYIKSYTITGNNNDGFQMTIKLDSFSNNPVIGDLTACAFTEYGYNGLTFISSQDIFVENFTVYTAPGVGVHAVDSTNLYFNRFKLQLKPNSKRLMTSTADGLHFDANFGDMKITNSLFENTHDDALNAKSGYYYSVGSVEITSKKIVISRKTTGIVAPKIDNKMEVYDPETFELIGEFTVANCEAYGDGYVITAKESLARMGTEKWIGANIMNASASAKLVFSNNIIRNKRNRGLLVQVRGALIENNSFINVAHAAIFVHSVFDFFNEAMVPSDIVIRGNKFINGNYLFGHAGEISVFANSDLSTAPPATIKNIEISNNFFSKNGNAAISLASSSQSKILSNLFHNSARRTSNVRNETAIILSNTIDSEVKNNYIYNTLGSSTFIGLTPIGFTDMTKIQLSNNVGMDIYEEIAQPKYTEIKKVDSTAIGVDGNLSDWSGIGTDIEMLGGSFSNKPDSYYESGIDYGFKINSCKFAWSDNGWYIMFDVTDPTPSYKKPNNFWTGDCVELFISSLTTMPQLDIGQYKNIASTMQAAFVPTGVDGWTINKTVAPSRTSPNIIDKFSTWTAEIVTKTNGYIGEIYIPFDSIPGLKQIVEAEEYLAVAIVFHDLSTVDPQNYLQIGNVPHDVEGNKVKTSKMVHYKFIN